VCTHQSLLVPQFFNEDLTTTPNLDAAFANGVILADHRSCSNWTAPSTYCAQSGNLGERAAEHP
jgi:arylsulfatase A-like enzyme